LNGRVASLLVGTVVCLSSVTALGVFAAPADAVAPTAAVPVEVAAAATAVAPPPVSAPVVRASATPILSVSAVDRSGISADVLQLALAAVTCAVNSGDMERPRTLTVIDYSRPSTEPRLWVFDVETGRLLFKELVAHGRNTGENMATRFSDVPESRQSSIGLFVTDETYVGSNGYSLRLDGLEPGFNGRARERAIVMHGAPYVNASLAASQGRIGRSWGCPALREAVARDVIDTIRGGGVIFSYYPDEEWLRTSRFLNCGATDRVLATN
jgi:hypothetical protein